jgi:CO/xanthine dehydrogenase Mo-binding subunit
LTRYAYAGDIVAAVAAESRETAEAALELIEVEYEELPSAVDVLAAAHRAPP